MPKPINQENFWKGIDALAAENGLSTSGLARRAGVDPGLFNPSRRHNKQGVLRSISTDTIARALDATGTTLHQFAHLASGERL